MPAKKDGGVSVEIRTDSHAGLVHFGFVQDGVFHPVASERQGDFDERVKAAKEADE